MSNEDDVMTVGEVARMLRVDPRVVSRWANEGRLTVFRTPGGHRRIRRSDLDNAMHMVNGDDWPAASAS